MPIITPHSWEFQGVRQLGRTDCLPACIATVIKAALGRVLSIETILESIKMTKRGCHLTEAGIYLQDSLFSTEYELWGWQNVFPDTLVGTSSEEIKKYLEEHSSRSGLYKGGKYLPYINSGGTLSLGGTIDNLKKKLEEGKLAIITLDDYVLNGTNTRKIAKHSVVAYKPHMPSDSQMIPYFAVYCPTQDHSHYLSERFDGLKTLERAIRTHPRGAVLYIDIDEK